MHVYKNITNTDWNRQNLFCGYVAMSAHNGTLANSREVSYMLFH